jgi:hypothetical protein
MAYMVDDYPKSHMIALGFSFIVLPSSQWLEALD